MTELRQFRLPDVGEGLTEADIVKWHVQPGDRVKINQVIVEIETAKAVVELPSPYEGVVAELLAAEGTSVDVGTPIVSVATGEGAADWAPGGTGTATGAGGTTAARAGGGAGATTAAAGGGAGAITARAGGGAAATAAPATIEQTAAAPDAAEVTVPPGLAAQASAGPGEQTGAAALPAAEAVAGTAESAGAGASAEGRQAVLVGYGVKLGRTTRRARRTGATPAGVNGGVAAGAAAAEPGPPAPESPAPAGSPPLAKPPVRKLAKDLGVSLDSVHGTGPHGSITRDDVEQAAAAPDGHALAAMTTVMREERIPVRGVRKHTAAAVTASAFTAPHVTEFLQVDVTGSVAALERIRALPEFDGLRVSPLLLAARALVIAAGRHPMINASWDEQAQEIVVRHYVNLGIAAATDRGLVVPNIKDAHALSLPGLARALAELTQTARAGRASPADLRDGTITITNVGVFGVDAGTPILTPGEAAILALGRVRDAPWVHEGQLAVRKVTTLALSFDHRIVDGDLGSAVLSEVGAMLEDPLRMLAWG